MNNLNNFKTYLLIFFVVINSELFAQSDYISSSFNRLGGYVSYEPTYYNADFLKLPGIPNCCPHFSAADGNGYQIGGLYEYFSHPFGFELRAGAKFISGSFNSSEKQIFGINGVPVEGKFEHILDFSTSNFTLNVALNYNVFERFHISLMVGTEFIFDSHFKQFERISTPRANVTFIDSNGIDTKKNIRNEFSGEIPEINTLHFLTNISLGYDVPLNNDGTIILRPQIYFGFDFSNMIDEYNWKSKHIGIGLSVYFSNTSIFKVDSTKIADESKIKFDSDNSALLKKQNEQAQIEKKELEDRLKFEEENRKKAEELLLIKSNELEIQRKQQISDSLNMLKEREEFDKSVALENNLTGKICNCFEILYISTTDKAEAEQLLRLLQDKNILNVKINIFTEPYLKTRYYRVISDCYSNHLEAFDDRYKNYNLTNKLNSIPQILCNRK